MKRRVYGTGSRNPEYKACSTGTLCVWDSVPAKHFDVAPSVSFTVHFCR